MASDLSDLLDRKHIFPALKASSVKQALMSMSESLANTFELDHRLLLKKLMEREQLGSTGIGHGVAIPHARIEGLKEPACAYARLETALDFDAMDARPCDLLVMLIAPEDDSAAHLRSLARVARTLRQESLRQELRNAPTEDSIAGLLAPLSAEDAA